MNKQFHLNPWFSFTVIFICVVFGIFAKSLIWILIFGFGAIIAFPNKRYQLWLSKKREQINIMGIKILKVTFFLLLALVSFWLISKLFGSLSGIGKYEGLSAEEWYNEYDASEANYQNLHDCVEPYAIASGYISADDLYYECF